MKKTFSNFLNEIQDEKKRNLITFVITGSNIEIVWICEQNGVNLSDSLSIATQFYQKDIFDWIYESYDLQKKFDNDENIEFLTDIFCSAATSNNIKIAKWCIFDRHAEVNRKNLNGKKIWNGCLEIFQLILKNCKDDEYNKNCLHYACEHNNSEICELLLTLNGLQNVNCFHPGFRRMNALCLACKNGSVSCVWHLLRYISEDDIDKMVNSHADYSLATTLLLVRNENWWCTIIYFLHFMIISVIDYIINWLTIIKIYFLITKNFFLSCKVFNFELKKSLLGRVYKLLNGNKYFWK